MDVGCRGSFDSRFTTPPPPPPPVMSALPMMGQAADGEAETPNDYVQRVHDTCKQV